MIRDDCGVMSAAKMLQSPVNPSVYVGLIFFETRAREYVSINRAEPSYHPPVHAFTAIFGRKVITLKQMQPLLTGSVYKSEIVSSPLSVLVIMVLPCSTFWVLRL